MACKVIVNSESGNCAKLDLNKLLRLLGRDDYTTQTIDSHTDWTADGFDKIVVCGGDGTLHNAIAKCQNKQLIYAPCGTLNEASVTDKQIGCVGKVNGRLFSYVCATGSFTQIGYSAQNKHKQKYKALAYLPQVVKSYRCHQINAKLNVDGKRLEGCYTILMVLKGKRCFGFDFNKCYDKRKCLYVLAIRSPGKDCLTNRIKMFARLFKVFFCGVKKPCLRKNYLLLPFEKLTVFTPTPQVFCMDGEKRILPNTLHFCSHTLKNPIRVVPAPLIKRKKLRAKI